MRLLYIVILGVSFIVGRYAGDITGDLFSKSIADNGVLLFILYIAAAIFFSLVIDPIENKYIWEKRKPGRYWFGRPSYDLAPITLGFTCGVLSVWVLSV